MELKNLQYLESIYRLRSFTRAAEEHYISQPSISNAVQKLERELGVTLINRNDKPLSFTENGERFMCHVRNILSLTDDAVQDMKELSDPQKMTLRLSWASTIGDIILPRIYTEFYKKYPQYQVVLSAETLQDMMKRLLTEEIDMAYAHIREGYDSRLFDMIPIQSCELQVLMSRDNPLSKYGHLSLEMLAGEQILAFPPGSVFRNKIEEKFAEAHIVPKLQTITHTDIIQELVEQNYGISFLTKELDNSLAHNEKLLFVPLSEPVYFLKGFLLKNGVKRTAAMKAMILFIQDVVKEIRYSEESSKNMPGIPGM